MEYRKFTVEEKQAFATQYANGVILKDLAAQAGVSIPTMAKYIRAGGGALRKPGIQRQTTGDAMKIVEKVNEIMAQANPVPEVVTTTTTTPEISTPQAPVAKRTILAFE